MRCWLDFPAAGVSLEIEAAELDRPVAESVSAKINWTSVVTEILQYPSNEGGDDMAGLDDLFAEIPVQDIASKLGADQGEVTNAIRTLVPALVGGLAQNVQAEDIDSSELESAVAKQGASGLLDGGVSVDQVDESEGDLIVAKIFGGNDSESGRLGACRHRRRRRRPDQEAAAHPGPDRAGLHRQAVRAEGCRGRGAGTRPRPHRRAGSATCWVASWAVPAALAAAASAASWAACSAASRAARSATSSAACSAARGRPEVRSIPRSPGTPHGVSGAFASAGAAFLECCGDRQFEARRQPRG